MHLIYISTLYTMKDWTAMIPEATTAAESALTESALGKLRSAVSGETGAIGTDRVGGANAGLSAAESGSAADPHAAAHVSATDVHAATADAGASTVRLLGQSRACDR